MPDTPLNPDALAKAKDAFDHAMGLDTDDHFQPWEEEAPSDYRDIGVEPAIHAYIAVAQPVVTGEQVNLAGWTCNGIHEPGDYSTCEECRDACDDLARFYNHMMQNPRQFKHWTGRREVNDA